MFFLGALRGRRDDLYSNIRYLDENLPLYTIYPKNLDNIGMIKMLGTIFGKAITEPTYIEGKKHVLNLSCMAMDSVEKFGLSLNMISGISILVCTCCRTETVEWKILCPKCKKINYCAFDSDIYIMKTLYEYLKNNNIVFNHQQYGWKSPEYLYQYSSFKLYNDEILNITRMFCNEFMHSFGNTSRQTIQNCLFLSNRSESILLKNVINNIDKINDDIFDNKKIQHVSHKHLLSIFRNLSYSYMMISKQYPKCLVNNYIPQLQYIAVYVDICRYCPKAMEKFNMKNIVYNVNMILIRFAKYVTKILRTTPNTQKRQCLTSITTHQITAYNYSCMNVFGDIMKCSTGSFEETMRQLKTLLKLHKMNINNSMKHYIYYKNLVLLFRDVAFYYYNGEYIFDSNATLHMNDLLHSSEFADLFTKCNDFYINHDIKLIPIYNNNHDSIKSITIDDEYQLINDCKENLSNYYTKKNEWKIDKYYRIIIMNEWKYGKLTKIYFHDTQYKGEFLLLKQTTRVVHNGFIIFKMTNQIKHVRLHNQPMNLTFLPYHEQDKLYLLTYIMWHKHENKLNIKYCQHILKTIEDKYLK